MTQKGVFIAATGQNVGKTTVCLGLIAGMRQHHASVGFIKPVGQQHVEVSPGINVDKDVVLFKEHFNLEADWEEMSPVIVPNGFTRDYLDGKVNVQAKQERILSSYQSISSRNPFTIVEGTGHVGVGSIIGLNNAQVAALLGLDMVIITSAGLGSSFDELEMNLALCEKYRVHVRGIILNKVKDNKRKMIEDYYPKALKRWNLPLVGCVPYNEFLAIPTIQDFENLFNTTLLSGETYRYQHFQHARLVAGSVESYKKDIIPNELIITPASREDIILTTLEHHVEQVADGINFCSGMVLTSQHPPSPNILERIRKADLPIIYAPVCSYDAMKMITSFTTKIRNEDTQKIERAINLIESNIQFEKIAY